MRIYKAEEGAICSFRARTDNSKGAEALASSNLRPFSASECGGPSDYWSPMTSRSMTVACDGGAPRR